MTETAKPSQKKRIIFLLMFLIGAGMFFVTTAGPLSGPAMSWNEAGAGLVPGALLLVIGHLLHTRTLGQQQEQRKAARWWVIATVFLLGLGTAMVVEGTAKVDYSKRAIDSARASQRTMNSYGGGYGGGGYGYDSTSMLERDVRHYKTAVDVGWGILAISGLFVLGTGLAFRRTRSS